MQLRFTFFYFGTFKLGLEITWQLRFVFARYCDGILLCRNDVVLRRHNYIIYLLDVVIFFHNVRITLYFGTFELRMEIMLQLCFVLAHHFDVFLLRHNYVIYLLVVVASLMTLELRYVLVRSNYVLKLRFKLVIF